MNIEYCPNEILLSIFEFLHTNDLIRAFHGLNARFRKLLLHHFTLNGLDFRQMSVNNFNIVCQEYLPNVIDEVPSLYLSEFHLPGQVINRLEAHHFAFGHFIRLKSISLSYLSSKQMDKITLILPTLINLTHLTIRRCTLELNLEYSLTEILIINQIWSLPKLKHCHFYETSGPFLPESHRYLMTTSVTSTSIIDFSITDLEVRGFDLISLFKHTPNLQYFHTSFDSIAYGECRTLPMPSITSLEIQASGGEGSDFFNQIVSYLPNLRCLKADIQGYIDGQD